MDEFPSNSRKPPILKEESKKKIEKVTTGEVTRRKQTLSRRFISTFIGGDAKQAWVAVVTDVLVPAAKDMAADALSQGFERMIYGEARSRSRRPSTGFGYQGYTSPSHISYNRFASNNQRNTPQEGRRPPISSQARSSHNFDEIVLSTRVEAEEVVDRLFDLVSRYESATVADLYELVGITGEYTDEKWGWTDIRGTDVSRIRDGYLLNLPKPEPLD